MTKHCAIVLPLLLAVTSVPATAATNTSTGVEFPCCGTCGLPCGRGWCTIQHCGCKCQGSGTQCCNRAVDAGAPSQSVKSCGGPNDHLKNPVIKLTPDPIVRGGTLTIEASGTLDEVITEFNTNVDLNIQALGVVHVTAKGGMPLSITPGAAKGPFSLTVGPFTLPSNVPGSAVVKGQVHVVNAKNEAVMCIDLDLNVPGTENEEALAPAKLDSPPLTTVTSCGKSTDHMPDFKITTSGGAITATGTLDEAVTKASIDLDVSVKVLFVKVPLKLKIPFATSPGLINRGPIKTVIGPSTIAVSPDVKATLKGTVKMHDGNGEEITCVNVDAVVAANDHIVV